MSEEALFFLGGIGVGGEVFDPTGEGREEVELDEEEEEDLCNNNPATGGKHEERGKQMEDGGETKMDRMRISCMSEHQEPTYQLPLQSERR